jgi:hypothetical protein
MSFNLEKYLTENNLTIISKIREEAGDEETGPSKADLKKTEKDFRELYKDKAKYAELQKKVKAVLSKYAVKQPDGSLKLKDVQAYKREVGNMPDQLKLLKQKIQQIENPETDTDEEPMD